jgi:hypothetical protein
MNGIKNYVWDEYPSSKIMSTYLVAFIVSKYGSTESTNRRGVKFSTWWYKDQLDLTRHTTKVSSLFMDYFEENIFKGIPYTLDKIDLVPLPLFAAGAMENWGLISFATIRALNSPNYYYSPMYMDGTIAHELVHMWCGNLVTLDWWNSLWLNEGFATYFQYHGILATYPAGLVWQLFGMGRDLMLDKHASESEFFGSNWENTVEIDEKKIQTPDDIERMFGVAHTHPATLIAMMVDMVGLETFLTGLRAYLKEKSYANAVADDLWRNLDSAVKESGTFVDTPNMTLKIFMKGWMTQAGYPILTITRNITSGKATVLQESQLEPRNLWHVWLTYHVPGTKTLGHKLLLPSASQELELPAAVKDQPLVFNRRQQGYFRQRYDARSLCQLARVLQENHTQLDPSERAQLIKDSTPMALPNPGCSVCGVAAWWRMMHYLKKERNIYPLTIAYPPLIRFFHGYFLAESDEVAKKFEYWLNTLIQPYFDEHGYKIKDGASEEEMMVQNKMMQIACIRMNTTECTTAAVEQLMQWLTGPEGEFPIHPRLRITVVRHALDSFNRGNYRRATKKKVCDLIRKKMHESSSKDFYIKMFFDTWIPKKIKEYAWCNTESAVGLTRLGLPSAGLTLENLQHVALDAETSLQILETEWERTLKPRYSRPGQQQKLLDTLDLLVSEVASQEDVARLDRFRDQMAEGDIGRNNLGSIIQAKKISQKCNKKMVDMFEKIFGI